MSSRSTTATAATIVEVITMADPNVYGEKLSLFSRMLRLEGLAVGPKETGDAMQVLTILDLTDREQVKAGLRTVFAKSREEQLVFDKVFDGFFVSEETMRRQALEQMEKEAQMEEGRRQAEEDLRYRGEPMDIREDLRDVYAAMSEEERQKLRDIMDKYKGKIDRHPELYGNFIHSVFTIALM